MKVACIQRIVFGTLLGVLIQATIIAGPITVAVSPSAQSVGLGDPSNLALMISGLGDLSVPSVGTFDLSITFDSTILAFADFTFGDPSLGDQLDLFGLGSIATVTPGLGVVNVFELSLDSATDLDTLQAGNFLLGTLIFRGRQAGTSFVNIEINALGDANGVPLDATPQNGSVSVTSSAVPEPSRVATGGLGIMILALFIKRSNYTHRPKCTRNPVVE